MLTCAELLDLSAERDLQERRACAMWREGYAAGLAARADDYSHGYADGVAARKHARHLLVDVIGTHLARWDGLRRDFGKPRPGEYAGGAVEWNGGGR